MASSTTSLINIVKLHLKLGETIQPQDFPQILDDQSQHYIVEQAQVEIQIEKLNRKRQAVLNSIQLKCPTVAMSSLLHFNLKDTLTRKEQIKSKIMLRSSQRTKKPVGVFQDQETDSSEAYQFFPAAADAEPVESKQATRFITPTAKHYLAYIKGKPQDLNQRVLQFDQEIDRLKSRYQQAEQAEIDRLYALYYQKVQQSQTTQNFVDRFVQLLDIQFGPEKSKGIL